MVVTDNIFLKAYFEMTIEAPALQTEIRGFLKDTTKSYTEILEEIHTNYRAQVTGEDIRGFPGGTTTTSALVKRATADIVKINRETDIENMRVYALFHDNLGHLIPTEFYSQVKRWYAVLSNLISSYTTLDK